jgi:signal transduction histidine kinase
MPTEKTLQFEASAYLQTLIGRELFRTEELAIVELVKNSYDSGAKNVVLLIRPPSTREPGEIVVTDDGEGMAIATFERRFMFAGYSERPSEVGKSERIPTGEKGIGRFASDRLGERLSILTKVHDRKNALAVEIDWSKFRNRRRKFSDIQALYSETDAPELAEIGHGTILRITKLRELWTRNQLLSLRNALSQLMNPYHRPDDFQITLEVPGFDVLSGKIEQPPVNEDNADIIVNFRVLPDGNLERWRQGKLYPREKREKQSSSVSLKAITGLRGRFVYFLERPTRSDSRGLAPGVRIYRDGFRVEPFGSQDADWLGLAAKRAKRAGHAHVVPTRLFGFVEISRTEHPDLKDTTSREALIDTDAARALVHVLGEQVSFLEDSIKRDIAEPRWQESRERKVAEFERAKIQALSIMSFGLAHELRQPLQSIRTEAAIITKRLKQLSVSDANITRAQQNIDVGIERIDGNIRLVAAISSGNADEVSSFDLARKIQDECTLLATRCAAQGIALETKLPDSDSANLNSPTVTAILLNLVKNSMEALMEVGDGRSKRIQVSLKSEAGLHTIHVSDNAYGIPPQMRPKIFRRFATMKTGGWGVGLYNCQLMAKAHNGSVSFETHDGLGTTFTVQLPDIKEDSVATPNPNRR